jgi:hypothetical protein
MLLKIKHCFVFHVDGCTNSIAACKSHRTGCMFVASRSIQLAASGKRSDDCLEKTLSSRGLIKKIPAKPSVFRWLQE